MAITKKSLISSSPAKKPTMKSTSGPVAAAKLVTAARQTARLTARQTARLTARQTARISAARVV